MDWNELAQLDELIASMEEDAADLLGVRLTKESLERRRSILIDEALSHREIAAERLDVIVRGAAATGRGVDLTFFAGLLAEIQATVASLAQAATRGATARGVIPIEIQDLTRLRLTMALPGSLAVRLVPAKKVSPQVDLFGETPAVIDQSIRRLLSILDQAVQDPVSLVDSLAEIGARTSKHLRGLTQLLIEGDADLSLTWAAPDVHEEVTLPRSSAFSLNAILHAVEESETSIVVEGRIVGGSLVRRRFELELPDETILSGQVAEEALVLLERYFGKECTATLVVRQAALKSGEVRESLSAPAAVILRRFVEAPNDELYGFQIIRETGIPSSTLYPALRLLYEDRGFLTSRYEKIDPAAEGRPPRRLYRLDIDAAGKAEAALREHEHHLLGPRRSRRMPLRPAPTQ
jgi:PadR family transcriptional regulator PadR